MSHKSHAITAYTTCTLAAVTEQLEKHEHVYIRMNRTLLQARSGPEAHKPALNNTVDCQQIGDLKGIMSYLTAYVSSRYLLISVDSNIARPLLGSSK